MAAAAVAAAAGLAALAAVPAAIPRRRAGQRILGPQVVLAWAASAAVMTRSISAAVAVPSTVPAVPAVLPARRATALAAMVVRPPTAPLRSAAAVAAPVGTRSAVSAARQRAASITLAP